MAKKKIDYAHISKEIVRTDNDVETVIAECVENPTKYRGQSFTDGVRQAIEWLTGETDDNPMFDDNEEFKEAKKKYGYNK